MGVLSAAAILAVPCGDIVTVDAPDLGGQVCLRPISGAEAAHAYAGSNDPQVIIQKVVTLSLCDEQGQRLFTLAQSDALFAKPAEALRPIIDKALEINRMTKEAADAARKG